MKKLFAKTLALSVALVMTTAMLFGCGQGAFSADTINIGASGPLTGGAAIYGTAVNNSAKLAINEINENGGLDGIKFAWDMMDDVHEVANVANCYATLMDRGMQISLGTVTSAPCLTYKNLAKADNLFCMTPSATADDVTKDNDNMYQMCFADSGQGSGAAAYVEQNYPDARVGVFYKSDDAYSTGIYNQFMKNYSKSNEVIKTTFEKNTASSFTNQINTLLINGCDFIFMPIYYQEASVFMTQAQSTTLSKDVILFGCDGFDGIASYEGFDVNTIKQEISYLSHFDSSATTGKAGDFIAKYTATYGSDTLNQFGAAAYDCIYAIYNALKTAKANGKAVNASLSASQFCNIITEVLQGDFSFDGVTGSGITWNTDGTVSKTPVKYIVKEKNA